MAGCHNSLTYIYMSLNAWNIHMYMSVQQFIATPHRELVAGACLKITTQAMTNPIRRSQWPSSDHRCSKNCFLQPPHAQDWTSTSSSWLSKVTSFRQETCQSYYRNDPVKYNLKEHKLDLHCPIHSPTLWHLLHSKFFSQHRKRECSWYSGTCRFDWK